MRSVALLVAGSAACALTQKAAPLELRYFSPEVVAHGNGSAERRCAGLHLGRVVAASPLRFQIVHRESAVELAPYDTLRWSELPDAYARRAVAQALFESRHFDQVVGGAAATLEIEVIAFEEVRRADRRLGRVELGYVVDDEHRVITRGTVASERVATTADIAHVVAAIGGALDDAAVALADRVAAQLCP